MLGDCYQAAAELVVLPNGALEGVALELVHGEVLGQGPLEGVRYGHAWVELNGALVLDHSNGREIHLPAAVYYELGDIDPASVVRYDASEARRKLIEFEHYGPWGEDE
jgi:hypothetical protein